MKRLPDLIKNSKKIFGFTLIEMVVVTGIVATLGLIFTMVLVQTLRGENKVKTIDQVKQTGQIVLDQMANEIRQSDKVICASQTTDSRGLYADTIILYKQGQYIRFRLDPPVTPPSSPTSNGYIARDIIHPGDYQAITDQTCNTPDLLTRADNELTYLTNKDDKIKGISIDYDGLPSNEAFVWTPKYGYNDIVTIRFRATAGVDAGQAFENSVSEGGVLFTTTTKLRGGLQ